MVRAICGSDTLTIVVSRISMKAASVTVSAISQRIATRLPAGHLSITVGTTETPSGSGAAGSSPSSMTIFTGTRCTILTKLPVAFSGGRR